MVEYMCKIAGAPMVLEPKTHETPVLVASALFAATGGSAKWSCSQSVKLRQHPIAIGRLGHDICQWRGLLG